MNPFTSRGPLLPLLIAVLTICLSLGCAKEQIDRQVWIERGQMAIKPFKEKLKNALIEGMESGRPEDAIDVCRLVAPEIAEEASSQNTQVGRTSHKLRNQRNAPKPWMQPLLDEYVANPGKSEPQAVSLGGGGVGYVEPIYVKHMCLACHGKDLSPTVAARIDDHYPSDKARNFNEGDFRGLFWVEFTKTE